MPSPFLGLDPEAHGLAAPLCADIRLLDETLGEVLSGLEGPDLGRICRLWVADSGPADGLLSRIPELNDPAAALKAARALTVLFQLLNLAEQKEIVRANRARRPRRESIASSLRLAREMGLSGEQMQGILDAIRIEPTLTAHPTEAKRRDILNRLYDISLALGRYGQAMDLQGLDQPLDMAGLPEADLRRSLVLLWLTPDVGSEKLTVREEAQNVRHYFRLSIMDAVSWVGRDLERALEAEFPGVQAPDGLVSYRSWVGGDRDGNPHVDAAATLATLVGNLDAYLQALFDLVRGLQAEIADGVPSSQKLQQDIGAIADALMMLAGTPKGTLPELAGVKDSLAKWDSAGSPLELLRSVEAELRAIGAESVARTGRLARLRRMLHAFGLHMAALDIRQHSARHEQAVAELLRQAGVIRDYSSLSEEDRIEILARELASPRPLAAGDWKASEPAEEVRATCRLVRAAHQGLGIDVIRCWIISMTHGLSDILEAALLLRDAGVARLGASGLECDVQIVPLLETIQDLKRAPELLRSLFALPAYREILAGQGMRQEVMLGYSDSSKDGGFLCANWSLFRAQEEIVRAGRQAGVQVDFFHGRGGTVGRGGGRASRALRSQPPGAFGGRVRFTEQGEVIGYRYGLPAIAHRHLEQVVGAVILEMAENALEREPDVRPEWRACMDRLAEWSRERHRALIEDPGFWSFYTQATPIDLIADLPIASRPVMRAGRLNEGLEELRAVPWNFAWVQSRAVLPGWFGVGAALERWIAEEGPDQPAEMAREWRFFQTLLENVELELGRARMETAAIYAEGVEPADLGARLQKEIELEFEAASRAILAITGRSRILDLAPVIRSTIAFRNPMVDPLNRLQACLRRQPDRDQWKPALLQTVAGLAAAMQSTG